MEPTREELFEIIVREHEPLVRAYVRAFIHDGGHVDDIVQDVFIAAWRGLDSYDRDRPLGAWLRGIAKNRIGRHWRALAAQKRQRVLVDSDRLAAVADTFETVLGARGTSGRLVFDALADCLEVLPAAQGEILCAVYHGGTSCTELARQAGESIAAVHKRLQRARLNLRECVTRRLRQREAARG